MINKPFFLFFITQILFSCQGTKNDQDIIDNYFKNENSKFRKVRTLKNWITENEIILFNQSDTIEDPHQALLIKGKNSKHFVLPFYSNSQKSYWKFPNDTTTLTKRVFSSDFNSETKKMFKVLEIDSTAQKAQLILEIFHSIFNCDLIKEQDSADLLTQRLVENYDYPKEDEEQIRKNIRNNYIIMSKKWTYDKYFHIYDCLIDEANNRVYKVEVDWTKKTSDVIIKSFRLDVNYRYMRM